jgi:hypothetical protein
MVLEELVQQFDLDAWREGQLLIRTVLPRPRASQRDPSHGTERTTE